MGKMKLKTVQNGTEGQSANLMANGSSTYRDENGYIIDGSGIFDASGNLIEEGWLQIKSGHDLVLTTGETRFEIEVKWGSGNVDLPLTYKYGANGSITPYVDIDFKVVQCLDAIDIDLRNLILQVIWRDSLTAHVVVPYSGVSACNPFVDFMIPFMLHGGHPDQE